MTELVQNVAPIEEKYHFFTLSRVKHCLKKVFQSKVEILLQEHYIK